MSEVSTQVQLQTAINSKDPAIQITGSFSISTQITINYETIISSNSQDNIFTLTKDSSFFGSVFRVTNGGMLTLRNIILDGDIAGHSMENTANRSLVLVTGGVLSLEEGLVLKNNYSYIEGGGVYLSGNPSYTNTLFMNSNAQITDCISRTRGGGIMLAPGTEQDSFTIQDQALISNNSAAYGGGIYLRSFIQGVGSSLTLADQVQITGNNASLSGGGIYYSSYQEGNSAPAALIVSGLATVSSNHSSSHGGGIYFYSANAKDSLLLSSGASVTDNTASQNGGGICLIATDSGALLHIDQASVTRNISGTGGGIYLLTASGGSLILSQGSVTDNEATGGASGSGGGIWLSNKAAGPGTSITMDSFTLSRNTASSQGGGLALFGGTGPVTLDFSQSTVSENTASGNGGGLFIGATQGGTASLTQCTLSSNTSQGFGGAFYYTNGDTETNSTLQMNATLITGNTAAFEGGGLRLSSGSGSLTTTLADCTVSSNNAQSSGGGIWNGGTTDILTLTGTTTVTENTSQEGNGGGIYFNSDNGSLVLSENTKITYNNADGSASMTGNYGGGICLVPGKLTIQDQAEIAWNKALKYGGGISASENSKITMNGGSIYGNQAAYGGGIYNNTESTAIITGNALFGEGSPNTASESGPGVYNKGTFYTDGSRNLTNGIYIESLEAVVKVQGALVSSSKIQIDNSGYVSPSSDGSPIVIGEATETYPVLAPSDADVFLKPPADFEHWHIRLSDDSTKVLLTPDVYTIHYENLMGAANPNPDTYTFTSPAIVLNAPDTLVGYRFVGWFDAPLEGSAVTLIPSGSFGDITLYAHWEIVTYTVTYCGNGTCYSPAHCVPVPEEVPGGQSISLSSQIPVRRNYCFKNWNTDCCGNGTSYAPGETVTELSSDLRLYAQWTSACSAP